MKAVILAGGVGSRLSEETLIKPKPLVEIGDKPILWHIMKIYSAQGINEFIICTGYKGHLIKEYFANYFLSACDITFDMKNHRSVVCKNGVEPWRVTVVDTGDQTMTGGRLRRVAKYFGNQTFCFTYGDGVSNIDVKKLVAFHKKQKALATLTAVQPPGRFGAFSLEPRQNKITSFKEKPKGGSGWINGGFFVLEPGVVDYIGGDDSVWEHEPLEALSREHLLAAYRHRGYWQNMDTLRDKMVLEKLWNSGKAPWKIW